MNPSVPRAALVLGVVGLFSLGTAFVIPKLGRERGAVETRAAFPWPQHIGGVYADGDAAAAAAASASPWPIQWGAEPEVAESVSDEQRTESNGQITGLRATVRYQYFTNDQELTTSEGRFCAPEDGSGECQWPVYGEGVLWTLGVGGLLSLLMLCCCGPCMWCCRCCCLGGYHPTYGFCIPRRRFDPDEGEGYSARSIWMTKIAAIVLGAASVVALILALTGSGLLSGVIPGVRDEVSTTVDNVLGDLEALAERIAEVNPIFTGNLDVEGVLDPLREFSSTANDFMDDIVKQSEEYDAYRVTAMTLAAAGGLFVFVSLAIGGLLNFKKLAWPACTCGFLFGGMVWFLFGIHYPLAVLLADGCYEVDLALNQSVPDDDLILVFDVVRELDQCRDHEMMVNLRDLVETGLDLVRTTGCAANAAFCDLTVPCPGAGASDNSCNVSSCVAPTNCTDESLAAFVNVTVTDLLFGCPSSYDGSTGTVPPAQCGLASWDEVCPGVSGYPDPPAVVCNTREITMAECATSCALPAVQEVAEGVVNVTEGLADFLDLGENYILPFANCTEPPRFVRGVRDVLCSTFLSGVYLTAVGCALFGSLACLGICVALRGVKRFNPKNRATIVFDEYGEPVSGKARSSERDLEDEIEYRRQNPILRAYDSIVDFRRAISDDEEVSDGGTKHRHRVLHHAAESVRTFSGLGGRHPKGKYGGDYSSSSEDGIDVASSRDAARASPRGTPKRRLGEPNGARPALSRSGSSAFGLSGGRQRSTEFTRRSDSKRDLSYTDYGRREYNDPRSDLRQSVESAAPVRTLARRVSSRGGLLAAGTAAYSEEDRLAASQVARAPWFVGRTSREDAERHLRSCARPAFLVRFSSQAGAFAASTYSPSDDKMIHYLLVATRREDSASPFTAPLTLEGETGDAAEFDSVLDFVARFPRIVGFTPVNLANGADDESEALYDQAGAAPPSRSSGGSHRRRGDSPSRRRASPPSYSSSSSSSSSSASSFSDTSSSSGDNGYSSSD